MFEICLTLTFGLCSEAALERRLNECIRPKLDVIAAEDPSMVRLGEPHNIARTGVRTFVELYGLGGKERMDFFASNLRNQWREKDAKGHPALVALLECFDEL